jgi:hypothetical protein
MNYEVKSGQEASVNEIFFDKNTNKLSFKNKYGIVKALETDTPQDDDTGITLVSATAISSPRLSGPIGIQIASHFVIPAGSIDLNNCVLDILCGARRLEGSAPVQLMIYANTSLSLSGAALLATMLNFTANDTYGKMSRSLVFSNGEVLVHPAPATLGSTDITTPSAGTLFPVSYGDVYIIFAMNHTAVDNVSCTTMHRAIAYTEKTLI